MSLSREDYETLAPLLNSSPSFLQESIGKNDYSEFKVPDLKKVLHYLKDHYVQCKGIRIGKGLIFNFIFVLNLILNEKTK